MCFGHSWSHRYGWIRSVCVCVCARICILCLFSWSLIPLQAHTCQVRSQRPVWDGLFKRTIDGWTGSPCCLWSIPRPLRIPGQMRGCADRHIVTQGGRGSICLADVAFVWGLSSPHWPMSHLTHAYTHTHSTWLTHFFLSIPPPPCLALWMNSRESCMWL